jgi:hypothetical protein
MTRLTALPNYLDKWLKPSGLHYQLHSDWQTRSRSSGDFDDIKAVGIHHAADSISTTVDGTIRWCTVSSPDRPIGTGTVTRTQYGPKFVLWAVRATNTQGRGGPVLTSRGVIPLDAGNRYMFSIEAMNNGIGERWSDRMCDLYVLVVCAVIDCINNTQGAPYLGAGDVFSHFEWAPARKNDPAGPCRWNGYENRRWDMTAFRRDVYQWLAWGPEGPKPEPAPSGPLPGKTTWITPEARYWVRAGGSPWSAAEDIYNDGTKYPALEQANPGGWYEGRRIVAPGVVGVATKVGDREGPWPIMRRIFRDFDTPPAMGEEAWVKAFLPQFVIWNGGLERQYKAGEEVFLPIG